MITHLSVQYIRLRRINNLITHLSVQYIYTPEEGQYIWSHTCLCNTSIHLRRTKTFDHTPVSTIYLYTWGGSIHLITHLSVQYIYTPQKDQNIWSHTCLHNTAIHLRRINNLITQLSVQNIWSHTCLYNTAIHLRRINNLITHLSVQYIYTSQKDQNIWSHSCLHNTSIHLRRINTSDHTPVCTIYIYIRLRRTKTFDHTAVCTTQLYT